MKFDTRGDIVVQTLQKQNFVDACLIYAGDSGIQGGRFRETWQVSSHIKVLTKFQ